MRIGGIDDFLVDLLKAGGEAIGKQIAKPDDKKKDDKKKDDKSKSAVASPSDIKAQTTMEVIIIGIGIYLLLEATQ